jgi:hypothetical protein
MAARKASFASDGCISLILNAEMPVEETFSTVSLFAKIRSVSVFLFDFASLFGEGFS